MAAAIDEEFRPIKINYEIHGNSQYKETMRPQRSAVIAALVVFGACTSAAPELAHPARTPTNTPPPDIGAITQQVRVTRNASRGPRNCLPENVGRQVSNFFAALNRGDLDEVMASFTDNLGWYSVTEGNRRNDGRHFVAHEPEELRAYFEDRVQHNERLHLLEIDVDFERSRNIGHVAYNILRSADDLRGYATEAGGKGAIDCETGRIAIWSMGQRREPFNVGNLCPGKPKPPGVAIACARP